MFLGRLVSDVILKTEILLIVGGSLESPWWLIGCFCLEILVRWWGPKKAFCHSVNVDGVVVLFADGGDTSPLYVIIELFVLTGGGGP